MFCGIGCASGSLYVRGGDLVRKILLSAVTVAA
jgi:hypothetical protein